MQRCVEKPHPCNNKAPSALSLTEQTAWNALFGRCANYARTACPAGSYSATGTPCAGTISVLSPPPLRACCPQKLTVNRLGVSVPANPVCSSGTYSAAAASSCQSCPGFSTSTSNSSTCVCNAGYSTSGVGSTLVCSGTRGLSAPPSPSESTLTHAGLGPGAGWQTNADQRAP